MSRKIEKSKELLEKEGASVTDVAYAVGFSSSQYFATVFKRCTNLKPSEWRSAAEGKKLPGKKDE
jgi:AraC-like DNA-binding protein